MTMTQPNATPESQTGQSVSWRIATQADAADIARIYNQGIAERIATYETEPRSPAEIAARLAEKGARHPTIVVERGGQVLAWAGAAATSARACYAGVADHSVYVDRGARGQGLGRVALEAVIEEYARRGFWKLVSRIFPENAPSLALHRCCGFRVVGVFKKHARLDGKWRDTVIVERLLGAAADET